jgi:hypothetical protein
VTAKATTPVSRSTTTGACTPARSRSSNTVSSTAYANQLPSAQSALCCEERRDVLLAPSDPARRPSASIGAKCQMRLGKCRHQEGPDTFCLWIAARVFAPDCKGVQASERCTMVVPYVDDIVGESTARFSKYFCLRMFSTLSCLPRWHVGYTIFGTFAFANSIVDIVHSHRKSTMRCAVCPLPRHSALISAYQRLSGMLHVCLPRVYGGIRVIRLLLSRLCRPRQMGSYLARGCSRGPHHPTHGPANPMAIHLG